MSTKETASEQLQAELTQPELTEKRSTPSAIIAPTKTVRRRGSYRPSKSIIKVRSLRPTRSVLGKAKSED